MKTTLDGLLNRRVMLEQPEKGFRVAMDTVFLAAAVPAKAGDLVLELGCGVGGAMLCLATRVQGLAIVGIEIQPELVELCRRNIVRNGFEGKVCVREGDVMDSRFQQARSGLPPLAGGVSVHHPESGALFCRSDDPAPSPSRKGRGSPPVLRHDRLLVQADFAHVLMNPPFHDEKRHDVSPHTSKRTANTDQDGDVAAWIRMAAKALNPNGTLTLIHRADRLEEISALLRQNGMALRDLITLLPRESQPSKRVILRAKKSDPLPTEIEPPYTRHLVLHDAMGRYTCEAEAVLRQMGGIE